VAGFVETSVRTFKTAWFSKAARKAHIRTSSFALPSRKLCAGRLTIWAVASIRSVCERTSTAPSFSQRPGLSGFTSTCLPSRIERTSTTVIIEFRNGEGLGALTPKQMNRLLHDQDWVEICNGNQA
jgi:hypothetical protein